jgi:hypothetical protein
MADDDQEDMSRYARIPGVDPYVDWALNAGRESFFLKDRQQHWISVLLLVIGIDRDDFAEGKGFIDPEKLPEWKGAIRVFKFYEVQAIPAEEPRFVTALVTERFFEILEQNSLLQKHVARLSLGLPLDDEAHSFSTDINDEALR